MSNYIPEDDGSVIGGIMAGYQNREPLKMHHKNQMRDGKTTDSKTYVCPKCYRAWENLVTSSGTTRCYDTVLYSTNITKYKKQRKLCKSCLEQG
jgi:protein-arginine kinase activator protein McsA